MIAMKAKIIPAMLRLRTKALGIKKDNNAGNPTTIDTVCHCLIFHSFSTISRSDKPTPRTEVKIDSNDMIQILSSRY